MLRTILFILVVFFALNSQAQTPILRPKPIVVNLADPKASLTDLTKEEKARFKELQKERKSLEKDKKKYFKNKLDSLTKANYDLNQAKKLVDDIPEAKQAFELWDQKDPYVELVSKGRNIYQQKDSLKNSYSVIADSTQSNPLVLKNLTHLDSTLVSSGKKDSLKNGYLLISDSTQSKSLTLLDLVSSDSTLILNKYDSAYLLDKIDSTTYFHLLDTAYTVNDSLHQLVNRQKMMIVDSLDSMNYKHYVDKGIEDLESRTNGYMEKQSELQSANQQEEELFSSYEEMIESDKYKSLMESMPGKREEIEADLIDKAASLKDYPELENVFKGHEKELSSALAAHALIKEKPTVKDVLSEFFDQEMEQVKKEKLKDRFSISGTIQVSNYDPVIIDFSPAVAFAISNKIQLGVGGSGRLQFGDDENQDLPDDVLAYRGFMDYDLFKGFYFHGEYERTGAMQENPVTEIESRFWSDRFLIGIGKDLKMSGILDGTIMLLYNLDTEIETSPNPRRIQVRYGIKIQ